MRQSRFTEERIIRVLKPAERGMKTAEVCRQHGVSVAGAATGARVVEYPGIKPPCLNRSADEYARTAARSNCHMRTSDIDRLTKPYNGDAESPTPGPASALRVDIPRWGHLEAMILENLSTRAPFGVAWWAPHPGTSRRILISDQLCACAQSVSSNMIESALHCLEFADSSDRHSDRFVNALRLENGKLDVKAPRPTSPLEELSSHMMRLHVVGCVRALAGALDCVAGTIIGVLALPTSILMADFRNARRLLKKMVAATSTDGERVQASFTVELERLISSVGPEGWLDWALDFRNMLVHRGRRIELGQYIPRTPVLYGPDRRPVPRVRVVNHLPRDPGRSDVEVFLQPSQTPVLTEDAEQTLGGLLNSTKLLIEGTAQELTEVWSWRRAHPDSLPQPAAQWPNGASSESIGFSGYAPESIKHSPGMMMTHPIVLQRVRAAALDDQTRQQWRTFD